MARILTFVLVFSLSSLLSSGQTVYLGYDTQCMERYEYVTDIDPDTYITYTFGTGTGDIVHFDVGKEGIKWISEMPGKITSCDEFHIDRGVVDRINNGTLKVYMVRRNETHFHLTQVDKATMIPLDAARKLTVIMEDTEFSLYLSNLMTNYNLSSPSSSKKVYLEGSMNKSCLPGYIFRKKDEPSSTTFKEYLIIPSLGIIDKRASAASGTSTYGLELENINGIPLAERISLLCPDEKPGTPAMTQVEEKPVSYEAESAVNIPGSYDKAVTGPCPTVSRPGLHVVQKGETLYSLSKRYGISLEQLKSWNNIGNENVISVCQELYVKVPSEVTAPPVSSVATTGPGVTETPKSGYWTSPAAMHEVKSGETVAQLANMYGYTEARFRTMNSLGAQEKVYPGQKLFTNDCVCPTLSSTTRDAPLPYEENTPRLTTEDKTDGSFKPVRIHTVKKGESFFGIARLYDTTVDRILELNGLNQGDQPVENQKLYVQ